MGTTLAGSGARAANPREEHLIPLMVTAGAAVGERGHRIFSGEAMGARISAFAFGELAASPKRSGLEQ